LINRERLDLGSAFSVCSEILAYANFPGVPQELNHESFFYFDVRYYIYYMKNRELNKKILIKLAPYFLVATILGVSFLLLHYLG